MSLPDQELLDLAARGPREVLDPCSSSGHFCRATPPPSKCARTSSSVGMSCPSLMRRTAAVLTETGVRRGHHDRLGHGGHAQQHLLDLERADVLAAADDDVGLAVGDGQVAVVVEDADVTGVVPAVVVECFRGQLVVGVAQAQIRTAAEDLAVLGQPDLDAGPRVAVGEQPLVLGRVCGASR